MKRLNYRIGAIFFIAFISFSSCKKLLNVNDIKPINQLGENEAITSVSQAQSVLYGAYGQLKSSEIISYNPGLTSIRGLTMVPGSFGGASEASYQNNEVPSDNYNLDAIYTKFYQIINNVNHLIEKAPLINTTDPRRNGIIGEAKFLRALCHFYLLRNQGYFFDVSSKYGIVLKKEPIKNADAQPRATVQESYDFILEDLNDAIAKSPSFFNTFYSSSEAAMALKAKVLLYQKKYAESAAAATQVITSGKFQLETSYAEIFKKKIIGTKEVIFQVPFDDKNDRNNKAFIFRAYYLPSPAYAGLIKGDNRDTSSLVRSTNGTLRNKKYNNSTYSGQSLTADTEYFLRLDELYLILAEALARNENTIDKSRDALNIIRKRAIMPNTSATTKAALLEAIRIEKILELGAESGEEWFDLVRYAVEGNLSIQAFKPGVTNETKYVLPLPKSTVRLSLGIVEQNPGY